MVDQAGHDPLQLKLLHLKILYPICVCKKIQFSSKNVYFAQYTMYT